MMASTPRRFISSMSAGSLMVQGYIFNHAAWILLTFFSFKLLKFGLMAKALSFWAIGIASTGSSSVKTAMATSCGSVKQLQFFPIKTRNKYLFWF